MKITVFTGNQPRHLNLLQSLAELADELFAIQECTTVFPGEVSDFFKNSAVMQNYFSNVIRAEQQIFGRPRFLPNTVRQLCLKSGDLSRLELSALKPALDSDYFVIFGASFIKGALCDFLVDHHAYNIHMGTSPFYRGSSCNFWALYDNRPDYVGATIHLLSKGLDSGDMLFHAFPKAEKIDGFLLGMKAVRAAHEGLVHHLKAGSLSTLTPIKQDKAQELRYSRIADFTDEIASQYLKHQIPDQEIFTMLQTRNESKFLRPFIV